MRELWKWRVITLPTITKTTNPCKMFIAQLVPVAVLLLLAGQLPVAQMTQPNSSNASPSSATDSQVIKLIMPGQPSRPRPNMPNPFSSPVMETVVFSAVRASDSSRRSVTKILFDNTVTDVGYGWDSSRSEFICFYPGIYFFSFSALSTPTSQFKVSLMKNGEEVVSTWGEQTGYHAGSNTVILQLVKSDRVYLNIQEGMIHETRIRTRGYTTFSGFRLY